MLGEISVEILMEILVKITTKEMANGDLVQ